MSSRFVSAGAIDPATGEAAAVDAVAVAAAAASAEGKSESKPNDEWLAVEKELAAERRRREEARKAASSGGEKSLFEVLQANKEAKQAAFEEANKIKNQFRALDDDEIDFLDEVRTRQRQEEDRVRRETEERVEAFRAAQRVKERGSDEEAGEEEAEWAPAGVRKRKRVAKGVVAGLKRKVTSESKEDEKQVKKDEKKEGKEQKAEAGAKKTEGESKAPQTAPATKPKMGLVSYDSDSDDD